MAFAVSDGKIDPLLPPLSIVVFFTPTLLPFIREWGSVKGRCWIDDVGSMQCGHLMIPLTRV